MRDAGDKIDVAVRSEIEEKINALKKAKESDSVSDMQKIEAELQQVLMKIGEALYNKKDTPETSTASGEQKQDPNIKDTDYKNVDEK